MKKLLNVVGKVTGIGRGALGLLSGKKAYLGGAALMLSGAAKVLSGAACWLEKVAAVGGLGDLVSLAQGAAHDPCSPAIIEGAAILGAGLAAVGLRHADAKLEKKVVGAE